MTGPSSEAVRAPATSGHPPVSDGSAAPARRQLRARASIPAAAPVNGSPGGRARADVSGLAQKWSERDIEYVHTKLAPENIIAKRNVVISNKEAELKTVVDEHDTAVKEKFHLERYTSIFEGWNPKASPPSCSQCT